MSVPLDERLHEEVRAKAARCRTAWPEIIPEAVALWLVAKSRKVA